MCELLKVDRLTVEVKTGLGWLPAVKDVSFAVQEGEIVGIVGESGSGKSLTALAMARLLGSSLRIASGQVLYKGKSIYDCSETVFSRELRGNEIAYVPQHPMTSLSPVLTVGEQLTDTYRTKHPKSTMREAKAAALGWLERVGMKDPERVLREYPHRLSGGMQQRAVIAASMMNDPQLLIADEPTTALDMTVQAQILDLLLNLKKQYSLSMVLISHDLSVIGKLCDRVLVLYGGTGVELGSAEDVFVQPVHPYTQALLHATPSMADSLDRLAALSGSVPALTEQPSGCVFHPRCSFAQERCHQEMPGLTVLHPGHGYACHYPQHYGAPEREEEQPSIIC
ncbi:ABC transporter ATP-binding protein [Paenibacillus turpanensis]|uniref:ABC transporter ATP-binding protein n=1 Tax=Paenibacillus turpanensis TaxID=2689078 RepID=UPI001407D7EB|nr:ABC transporter ATP-binding protein [Paenibacillus turpanensis]